MTRREIGFEWALEGKRPGAHDDYELLSWSDDRLGPEVFEEIRSRYATGLSADLPQVTIAVAATRERERVSRHIVLAIQDWSGHRDATNRKIVYTRWFYIPYHELAAHPVSYEALYHALAGLPVTPSPPLAVQVPEFDPTTGFGEEGVPGPDALSAAALLLTGRPVCVVGADSVPMIERLRFLDAVAALLPYGMRARLTAATWTSSTARHKIRLSFARHAPEDAYEVRWRHGAEITRRDSPANVCLDLLTRSDVRLADLLRGLARETEPLSFGPADRPMAVRLLEHSGYPELPGSADEAEPEPRGTGEPRDGGEPDNPVKRGTAAPASGAPDPPGREPAPERHGGDAVPAGTSPPAGNARRLTLPVRSVLTWLGRGHGRSPAPGAPPDGTAAPTTPYRRTADEGPAPGAVPLSMQAALGGLEHADRGKQARSGRGPQAKVTVTVAFATLGITLIGLGVVALVRAPGGDPPTGPDVAEAQPGTVVIQAANRPEDAFATNVVAEVVRRSGYRFEIRRSDIPAAAAPVEKPAVVLIAGPDSALTGEPPQGFVQAGTIPVPSPDVLVYDIGQITPEKLRAALKGQDKDVRVSLPDTDPELAEALKRRYPSLRLQPVPARDPLRALRDKVVQAAVVPRTAGDGGYARVDGPDGLPGRTILAFYNGAALNVLHDALGRVAGSIDPGALASAEYDWPGKAAARVVGAVLPPGRPSVVSRAGERDSDQGQDSLWLALVLIAAGGVAGFVALIVAIRGPSRFEPRP
ncbi:hypothetical protein ACQP1V_05185 [Microtetraspora malaysiensis]|uniref:hypothetical protein n=1 Tax=Microtetraspora malaysiensis TaxID=161358 RepID=UPI003D95012F